MLYRTSKLEGFFGHRLRVLENSVLRGIFVSKRGEIIGF
jgi:hypothetical protein